MRGNVHSCRPSFLNVSFIKCNMRKIRTVAAVVVFLCITAMFLDFTGVLHHYFALLAKMQFFPAVMAGNVIVVCFILLVTLLFGRFYCSIMCPLGVMQDGFNFVARKVKKNRFSYVKERPWLRYSILGVFVVLILVGLNALAALIAPYSAYGRIATSLLQPVYVWFNNILAAIAEGHESYAFYERDVWLKSALSLGVAAVTLVLIGIMALHRGRTWCSNICPVGTVLGLVSRFSLFRPEIDVEKCRNCRKCEKNCKASCIDIENHRIDYSRCVACMDCVDECKFGALDYVRARKKSSSSVSASSETVDTSRRAFMATASMTAAAVTLRAQEHKVDGMLAAVDDKLIPQRDVALKPAGAISLRNFDKHCTSCQLCVSECPNGVLRASEKLSTLLQPEMSFERGWCRPECTRCGEVCPTGAIHPVTKEQKTDIHVGYAVIVPDNCVAYKDGEQCGNCARHCPAGAVVMVEREDGVAVPSVNTDRCIGCGACEYLCPSRPFSAIYVNGREVHIGG